jgi:hypothetical protein
MVGEKLGCEKFHPKKNQIMKRHSFNENNIKSFLYSISGSTAFRCF